MRLGFWKDVTNKKKAFGELLADLLKEFDCLCQDLLIAKVHPYGYDIYLP